MEIMVSPIQLLGIGKSRCKRNEYKSMFRLLLAASFDPTAYVCYSFFGADLKLSLRARNKCS